MKENYINPVRWKFIGLSRKIFAFFCSLLLVSQVFGQQINVSGTVKDVDGAPLIGASVMWDDKGTVSDANGKFTAVGVSATSVLTISYVGYQTQKVSVNSRSSIDVVLKENENELDKTVVIGYGTIKKRDLTGAVSSVKSEDIVLRPGPNPMEAIQGRVAGLDITRESGQPGAELNIQLRGTRSFTASGKPLFLVDGMPGDYETINPNDIESIEVLKDASSTAVYGSAGANGVIIITTKGGAANSGKSGLNVNFNSYYGFNGWSLIPKMRTGESYLETIRDANKYVWNESEYKWTTTGAVWHSPSDDEAAFGPSRYPLFQKGQFVDWAKELMQTASTQNYSLSVSGGNDKTQGYISFNYTKENGQYSGDDYKLFSTNTRIDHSIKKWISIGSNIQASYVNRNKAYSKLENALVADPLFALYKDDGSLNPGPLGNIYNLLLNNEPGVYENLDNNLKLYVNPYIEIRPIKGLTLLSRANVWMNYSNNYLFEGIGSYQYYSSNGSVAKAQIKQNRSYGYKWENVLTYNFTVANDHDFTITGVTSWSDGQNTNTTMKQSNITSNNYKWYNFKGDVNTTAESEYNMSKSYGLVGRINYSYLGKYLFSASVRYDGASQLYKTNRWDTFPAVSVGWRVSDEKFMEGTRNWLDNLKFRVGYGVTGTAKIDAYSSESLLESTNMSLGGTTQPIYRYSKFVTNPDLTWEKSYNMNYGIDASVFKNRVDFSVDYYETDTKGVIWSVKLPVIYGAYTPGTQYETNMNICRTNNKGIEVAVNTRNIITKDFQWTSSLTFAYNKEKIVSLTGGYANNIAKTGTDYTLTIGQPINSYYALKLNGVWQIGEENDAKVFQRKTGELKVDVPGLVRAGEGVYYKDENGSRTYYYADLAKAQQYEPSLTAAKNNYLYSAKDNQVLGHNSPDWSLGFQNGISYKGFDLNVLAYARWGQMIRYKMLGWYMPSRFATGVGTIPEYWNYWTPENPSNDFPVMQKDDNASAQGYGSLLNVDGSFLKIKNITLGYTLPKNFTRKASIERCRFYATITNPWIFAKNHLLKQYDPEMNGDIDYPLTKQVVFGINLTF